MNPFDTLTTDNPRSYDLARATVGDFDGIATSEVQRKVTLLAVDKAAEPPKGLGSDRNKPLMRNGKADEPSAQGIASNIFDGSENQERLRSGLATLISTASHSRYPAVDSFTSHRVNCSQCVTGELCGEGYGLLMVAQMELEAA